MCLPLLLLLVPMTAAMQHEACARGDVLLVSVVVSVNMVGLVDTGSTVFPAFMHTAVLLLKQGLSM